MRFLNAAFAFFFFFSSSSSFFFFFVFLFLVSIGLRSNVKTTNNNKTLLSELTKQTLD